MNQGKFIAVEGIDGSGKTGLVRLVCEELGRLGYGVMATHEPGSQIEPYIRGLFKRPGGLPSPDEMAVMFTADRLTHMDQTIRPALANGITVLTDRHKLSTLVYQTVSGADPELLEKLVAIPQPEPDLTIILDLDPKIARARLEARNPNLDSYERHLERQVKMRELYLEHRNRFGRSHVIDASRDQMFVVTETAIVIKSLIDGELDDQKLAELEKLRLSMMVSATTALESETSKSRDALTKSLAEMNSDLDWLSRFVHFRKLSIPKSLIADLESFIRAIVEEAIYKSKGNS